MDHPVEKHRQNNGSKEDLVFYVRIQYRRNTSWQGTIQWMDGKKNGTFRSVLELGCMINEAKRQKEEQEGKRLSDGWKNKGNVS